MSLRRASLDWPTRRVCGSCAERLRAGEEFLSIADDFWTLSGARRDPSAKPIPRSGTGPRVQRSRIRPGEALPSEELRGLVADIRRAMRAEIVGQDDAVSRLALLAALHVGGELSRGGRALLLGPSGVGKTSLVGALRRALEPFGVPFAAVDCIDLTSPGWSGAPSVGDVIKRALGDFPVDGAAARHAVIVLDELHHIARAPETTGNMQAKRQEVLSSLLGLTGHGAIRFEDGTEWSSRNALVIGVGAFTDMIDLSRPVTIGGLTKAGLPLELATRMVEDVIVLRRLREPGLVELLRSWPALETLSAVCTRLGYTVRVVDEAYGRAVRAITLGRDGSTPRTAGSWLVAAVRRGLIAALNDPNVREIVVTPDSLDISPSPSLRSPPEDPPDWGPAAPRTR